MKKTNLILLALFPMCLIGCKDKETEKALDYEKLTDYGTTFKINVEIAMSGKMGEGLPSANQIARATYERNGDIAFTSNSSEGTLSGNLEEAANYLSDAFDVDVEVSEVEKYLGYAKGYSEISDFKIEGDNVFVTMPSNSRSFYYDYSAHGLFPVTWSYDSDETSDTYQKWVGSTSSTSYFDIDLSDFAQHAKEFTLDREKGVLSMSDAKAKELKIVDEDTTLEKYNMYLNDDDKIVKIEQVGKQGALSQSVIYTIETSSNLALPSAENRAPLCTHPEIDTTDFSWFEIDGEWYHCNTCDDCGSIVNPEKCDYDDDGFCKVCEDELLKEIKLAGPEGYEAMIYLVVNGVTNKIRSIDFNYYCESLDGTDYIETNYFYRHFDSLVCEELTSESYFYGRLTEIYIDDVPYVYIEGETLDDGKEVYYFLTNCVIEQDNVLGPSGLEVQYTLTYDSLTKFIVGDVYTPGN